MHGSVTGRGVAAGEEHCKPFLSVWSELSIENGCILRVARTVVPEALREPFLKELHADHQGTVKSKAVA